MTNRNGAAGIHDEATADRANKIAHYLVDRSLFNISMQRAGTSIADSRKIKRMRGWLFARGGHYAAANLFGNPIGYISLTAGSFHEGRSAELIDATGIRKADASGRVGQTTLGDRAERLNSFSAQAWLKAMGRGAETLQDPYKLKLATRGGRTFNVPLPGSLAVALNRMRSGKAVRQALYIREGIDVDRRFVSNVNALARRAESAALKGDVPLAKRFALRGTGAFLRFNANVVKVLHESWLDRETKYGDKLELPYLAEKDAETAIAQARTDLDALTRMGRAVIQRERRGRAPESFNDAHAEYESLPGRKKREVQARLGMATILMHHVSGEGSRYFGRAALRAFQLGYTAIEGIPSSLLGPLGWIDNALVLAASPIGSGAKWAVRKTGVRRPGFFENSRAAFGETYGAVEIMKYTHPDSDTFISRATAIREEIAFYNRFVHNPAMRVTPYLGYGTGIAGHVLQAGARYPFAVATSLLNVLPIPVVGHFLNRLGRWISAASPTAEQRMAGRLAKEASKRHRQTHFLGELTGAIGDSLRHAKKAKKAVSGTTKAVRKVAGK